jgi:hypothetical protein
MSISPFLLRIGEFVLLALYTIHSCLFVCLFVCFYFCLYVYLSVCLFVNKLRNGHSHATLANLSTCQKFAIFGKYSNLPTWSFSEMCRTRQTRQHLPPCFARTCQTRQHLPNHLQALADSRKASLSSFT